MKRLMTAGLATALLLVGTTSAFAGGREPGSLLVYPAYDSNPGAVTLITITNVSFSHGTWIEYHYIDGETCSKQDRTEYLTPRDTLTVVASAHNTSSSEGYVYVYAKNGQFGEPVSFNYLVGQVSTFNGIETIQYTSNAYAFSAIEAQGELTDNDSDGQKDLDGSEYEMAPDVLVHPRFLAQDDSDRYPGVYGFSSEIVLIDLTGGRNWDTTVEFLVYNDNEEQFSAEYSFTCWHRTALLNVTEAFGQGFINTWTDHDEDEIFGAEDYNSGWFDVDGVVTHNSGNTINDPAVLTFLIETSGRAYAGADLPFQQGHQANGDLRPNGEG